MCTSLWYNQIHIRLMICLSKFTVNGQIDVWISTEEINYWANVWRGERFLCEEIQRKNCFYIEMWRISSLHTTCHSVLGLQHIIFAPQFANLNKDIFASTVWLRFLLWPYSLGNGLLFKSISSFSRYLKGIYFKIIKVLPMNSYESKSLRYCHFLRELGECPVSVLLPCECGSLPNINACGTMS